MTEHELVTLLNQIDAYQQAGSQRFDGQVLREALVADYVEEVPGGVGWQVSDKGRDFLRGRS